MEIVRLITMSNLSGGISLGTYHNVDRQRDN